MARQASVEQPGAALPEICQPVASAEEQGAPLLQLVSALQFNECISRGLWLVFFSSPVCGHCKSAHEQLREYAQGSYGRPSNLQVGLVDCSAALKVCAQEGIKEMPVLRLYINSLKRSLYMAPYEYPAPKPTGVVYKKTSEGGVTVSTNAVWSAGIYAQWVKQELESLKLVDVLVPREASDE
eukprot:jgi/Mesvir1/5978/Mv00732-RA.1